MLSLSQEETIHRIWLYRVLTAIVDEPDLQELYFKGGTAAAMLNYLDRFSIDLDFDYQGPVTDIPKVRQTLKKIFKRLGLEIKDESQKVPQFFLKYPASARTDRNTLKVDVNLLVPKANKYEIKKLIDIDRLVYCQTKETMFANKLVAVLDRYKKNNSLAGRDIYDIHHFFLNGFKYNSEVIKERSGLNQGDFFIKLKNFIISKVTNTILDQDLNMLLPYDKFKKIRKILKSEVLFFINEEIKNLEKGL